MSCAGCDVPGARVTLSNGKVYCEQCAEEIVDHGWLTR